MKGAMGYQHAPTSLQNLPTCPSWTQEVCKHDGILSLPSRLWASMLSTVEAQVSTANPKGGSWKALVVLLQQLPALLLLIVHHDEVGLQRICLGV